MDSMASDTRAESHRYRALASAIRGTLPIIHSSEVREELWVLVAQYEELARHIEARQDDSISSCGMPGIGARLPLRQEST